MKRSTFSLLIGLILIASAFVSVTTTAAPIGDPAFHRTWERADRAVTEGVAIRSWLWGPEAYSGVLEEPYAESPGGMRRVQYFDKSRMEITHPGGDQSSQWYVTNGLLAKELITGERQIGDNEFETLQPADVGVAGDPNDLSGPTYATFSRITQQPSRPLGAVISDVLARDGTVSSSQQFAAHDVTASQYEPLTGYTTASVFQTFIDAQGTVYENGAYTTGTVAGVFAVGLPITEAYWARVTVAGTEQDVLVQCFERRCLTFTPSNDLAWQVEMGNVGQHYQRARYGVAPAGTLVVHYLDVGQADATLLKGPDFTILIDAGDYQRNDVVPYLQSVGVTEIDLLIGTHPHADHIGQFPQVLSTFTVHEVWLSGDVHTTQTFERAIDAILASGAAYHEPRAGQVFTYGSIRLDVVNPATTTGNFHEGSIGVRAVYGMHRFMFTGDAEAHTEQAMINRGHDLRAEFLQLGHHGSSTSTSDAFLDAVQPSVAIYSAGSNNQFGHPHADVISRLESRGITIFGTDTHGWIRIVTDGVSGGSITTQKTPDEPPPATVTPIPTPTATPDTGGGCVNLNTASFDDLQKIIHIGPDRAQQIISLRPFSSVDDLTRVSGIGSARLADIKAQGLACV